MRVRVGRHQRQAALHRFAGRHTDFYGTAPTRFGTEDLRVATIPETHNRRTTARRGEPGCYNYGPEPYTNGAMPVWFWSMKDADKKLIAGDDWVPYLGGDDPGFPVGSGSSQSLTLVNAKTNAPDKSVLVYPDPPLGSRELSVRDGFGPPVDSLSDWMWLDRAAARRQASATSNAVTLRVSRLSSTPIRWIGSPCPRYLSA